MIRTDRLVLRNVEAADLDALVKLWGNSDVAQFMGDFGPRGRSEVEGWLPEAVAAVNPEAAAWVLSLRASGDVVGLIMFGRSSPGGGDVDFAYIVDGPHRGQGYASEALRATIEYCFDTMKITSFWGECDVDNAASAGAMRKAGLRFVGVIDGQQRFRVERTASRSATRSESGSRPVLSQSVHSVLAVVNRTHHTDWEVVGPLTDGYQSGAWKVSGARSGTAVLKWSEPWWAPRVLGAAKVVEDLIATGYPTPRWLAYGLTPTGGAYVVQEFVAGAPATTLSPSVTAALLKLVDRHAGAGPSDALSWSRYAAGLVGDEGIERRGRLSQATPIVSELMRRVAAFAAANPVAQIPDDDLVHGDFNLSNVLFDNGEVVAVVDIEGVGRGCRAFDMLTLGRQHMVWSALEGTDVDLDVVRVLHRAALGIAPPRTVACLAGAQVIDLLTWGLDRWGPKIDAAALGMQRWLDEVEDEGQGLGAWRTWEWCSEAPISRCCPRGKAVNR